MFGPDAMSIERHDKLLGLAGPGDMFCTKVHGESENLKALEHFLTCRLHTSSSAGGGVTWTNWSRPLELDSSNSGLYLPMSPKKSHPICSGEL